MKAGAGLRIRIRKSRQTRIQEIRPIRIRRTRAEKIRTWKIREQRSRAEKIRTRKIREQEIRLARGSRPGRKDPRTREYPQTLGRIPMFRQPGKDAAWRCSLYCASLPGRERYT